MDRTKQKVRERIQHFLVPKSKYLFHAVSNMITVIVRYIAIFPFISALSLVLLFVGGFLLWAKSVGWQGEWFQIGIWLQAHVVVLGLAYCAIVGVLIGLGELYRYRAPQSGQPALMLRRKQLIFVGGLTFVVGFLLMGAMSFGSQTHASHGCSDAVDITANTSWTTNQCHGAVTISNGATLTISGNTTHSLTSLTLGNGVTNGFITAQGDTVNGVGVTITTDSDIEVKASSSISANAQGYAAQTGPGSLGGTLGAASHGGVGSGGTTANTYGSATAPITLGSGSSYSAGGGAIKLNIAGNFINNGTVSANSGSNSGTLSGSGGSIWINFTGGSSAWSGSGGINANALYDGGGGRVAVTGYVTDTHAGSVTAYSSRSTCCTTFGVGTVYTKSSSQTNGTLTIDNNDSVTPSEVYVATTGIANLTLDSLVVQNRSNLKVLTGQTLTIAASGSMGGNSTGVTYNAGTVSLPSAVTLSHKLVNRVASGITAASTTLTIASGGTLVPDATTSISAITVQSGGNITHSDNSTAETYKIDLSLTNLTVDAGGTINVNTLGYDADYGPGAGGSTSGGSYGGLGLGSNAGNTYGTATEPSSLGSGGDQNAGGGAIKLTISGNLTNNGTISANAATTTTNYGGSGGSVWIIFTGGSSTWSGNGSIAANSTYDGGGGRVSVTGYVTDTHSGSAYALGVRSSCCSAPAPGTVYTKSSSQTNGTLTIDNNDTVNVTSGKYARSGITNLTLDALVVQNRGTYEVPSSSTLTITSTGSITHSANSTIVNQGTFTSTGITHTISGTFTADGTNALGTVTVASGGTVNHSDNSTAETYKSTITATAITVSSGGLIDVNSLGYDGGAADTAGNGTGAGALGGSTSAGGGGGYGGIGGTGGGASGGAGGTTYGTSYAPSNIGSGGGGGDTVGGGAGGGAMKITTTGNLTVTGTIRANGANGSSGSYGGGGGSGGSIWLIVGGNLNCTSGTITANGGNGAGTTQVGGGGGGGRLVRNVTGTYTACTTYTASAGTGGSGAGAGTTYVPPTTPTGLSAGSITSNSITWSLTDASTTETAFRLYSNADALLSSTTSTTTGGTGTSYNLSDSSLSPNTQYIRYATAYDGTADSGPTSSVSARTLANAPGTPTVNGTSTSSLTVIIDVNSNPVSTEFALYETGSSNYVQADGTLNTSPAWQTYTTWGGASGQAITGLSVNTAYSFQAKARNADNTETALSSSGTKYTLANAPGTPTGSAASATSATVIITTNSNPAATEFSIFNDTTDTYVQTDGTLGASAAWQTYTNWGGASGTTATGLSPNTSYSFTTKARNGNNTETSASDSVAIITNAAVPAIASVEPVSDTGIRIKLSVNGNPASTEFAIYNATVGNYVAADGTLTSSPIWQTYTAWGGSTGVVNTGLIASTTYDYQAKARNSLGVQTAFSSVLNTTTAVASSGSNGNTNPTPTPAPNKGKKPTPTPEVTATPSPSPTPEIKEPPQCQSPGLLKKLLNFLTGKASDNCHPTITPLPSPTPICLLLCDVTLGISMTPEAGTYTEPINVAMTYTPTDHDANIYYTLDGNAPNTLSILYRKPIYLEEDATVSAKAIGSESPTVTQSYTISSPSPETTPPPGQPPVSETTSISITPSSGNYSSDLLVILAGSGPVAGLFYTADGSDPRVNGLPYYGPITLSHSSVITAVAKDTEGNYSELAREEYQFTNYTETVIIDWDSITEGSISPSPTSSSSTESTATPVAGDVTYDVLCNGDKVIQTNDTTYSDAAERLDGCHYDVTGKTQDGEDIGPIEDLVITRIAGVSSLPSGAPYQVLINLMLIIASGLFIYAFIAWFRKGFADVAWQLTVMVLGPVVFIYRNRRASITGVVRDEATRQPIPYAIVKGVAKSGKVVARTVAGANGQFRITASNGIEKLIVTHPSYRTSLVTVSAGGQRTLDIYCSKRVHDKVQTTRARRLHGALLTAGIVMSILLFLNQVTWGLAILVTGFVLMGVFELLFAPHKS